MISTKYEHEKKSVDTWRLVVSLLAVGAIAALAVAGYPSYQPLPQWTGILSANVLNSVGIFSAAWGDYLIVENLPPLKISAECSGIVLLLVFPLTIFLMPVFPLTQRFASLLFVPFLFFGNTMRIITDVLVAKYISPDMLLFYHDSLGQVFIFFWGITAYLVWLIIFGNFPKDWVVEKLEKFGRFS